MGETDETSGLACSTIVGGRDSVGDSRSMSALAFSPARGRLGFTIGVRVVPMVSLGSAFDIGEDFTSESSIVFGSATRVTPLSLLLLGIIKNRTSVGSRFLD